MVHWNKKYESPEDAAGQPDGLAVLGRFIKVGDDPHEELEKVLNKLDSIRFKGDSADLEEDGGVDAALLLPDEFKREFFTYEGSLTTPPLLESVIWIVFKDPIEISAEQVCF